MTPELEVKQLELVRELLPKARRVAMLLNANHPGSESRLAIDGKSTPSLDLTLVPRQIRSLADIEMTSSATAADHDDAVRIEFSGTTMAERTSWHWLRNIVCPQFMESGRMPKLTACFPTTPSMPKTSDAQPFASTRCLEARNQAHFRSKSLRG